MQDSTQRGLFDAHALGELRLIDSIAEDIDPIQGSPARVTLSEGLQLSVHDIAPAARDEGEALSKGIQGLVMRMRIMARPASQEQFAIVRHSGYPTQMTPGGGARLQAGFFSCLRFGSHWVSPAFFDLGAIIRGH